MTAEAIFEVPSTAMREPLDALGVELEGSELIVNAKSPSGGRSRVLVNGSRLSVRELASAMDRGARHSRPARVHGPWRARPSASCSTEYGDHVAFSIDGRGLPRLARDSRSACASCPRRRRATRTAQGWTCSNIRSTSLARPGSILAKRIPASPEGDPGPRPPK